LVFLDESGKSLVCPLKRTWAPRGQTPTLRTSVQHHQRANVIGALLITPKARRLKLRTQLYQRTVTGEQVLDFLRQLLRQVRGPIVLVWDNAPIHNRKKVQAFIEAHPRLQVYCFPTCAPELNPVEHVWAQVTDYLSNTAPEDFQCLCRLIRSALRRSRRSQTRLWSCIHASALPWKRRNADISF
jgi:transposase